MITGAHALIWSREPDATRAFFRDVLGFDSVDAHDGWLIFALPPAELGIHPAEGDQPHRLYLMCDDIEATMRELKAKGATFTRPVQDEGFGPLTAIALPGGGEIGLYQPTHATALRLTR